MDEGEDLTASETNPDNDPIDISAAAAAAVELLGLGSCDANEPAVLPTEQLDVVDSGEGGDFPDGLLKKKYKVNKEGSNSESSSTTKDDTDDLRPSIGTRSTVQLTSLRLLNPAAVVDPTPPSPATNRVASNTPTSLMTGTAPSNCNGQAAFNFSFCSNVSSQQQSPQVVRKRALRKEDLQYSTSHKFRGLCLLVHNDKFEANTKMRARDGSVVDFHVMNQCFRRLGFAMRVLHNVSKETLQECFLRVSSLDHSDCDCFVCVILSHGEEGVVYGTNGTVALEDLVAPFRSCKSLAGKPKLFFIQACRGTKLDSGVECTDSGGPEESRDESDGHRVYRIPAEADFLMAYSVSPGYYAWRNSTRGAWFIQALAEMLEEYGATRDLMWIMTRVNRKVAYDYESNSSVASMSRKKQVPCIVSMLTKDVYFPPKNQ